MLATASGNKKDNFIALFVTQMDCQVVLEV